VWKLYFYTGASKHPLINNYGKKFCKILKMIEDVAEEVGRKGKEYVTVPFCIHVKNCAIC
jgi:hypothetical protein